jgi:hypothetical protein
MIIKTKKYKLENNTYLKLAMKNVMLEFWWAWLIPVAIMLIPVFVSGAFWWCFSITLILVILYPLFWLIQFVAVTQMEQAKPLFERLAYEIDSRQILIKLNAKEGMQITWDNIKQVKAGKDYFMLILSRAQFIHLPFDIFKSENEVKFMEAILRRKKLLKSGANEAE